jgi:hypothetical protein
LSISIISFSLFLFLFLFFSAILLTSKSSLNSKLLLINSSLFSTVLSSFNIINFLLIEDNNLFLDLVTILPTLEKVASKGVEVAKIAK